jgi:hypothetical protein
MSDSPTDPTPAPPREEEADAAEQAVAERPETVPDAYDQARRDGVATDT